MVNLIENNWTYRWYELGIISGILFGAVDHDLTDRWVSQQGLDGPVAENVVDQRRGQVGPLGRRQESWTVGDHPIELFGHEQFQLAGVVLGSSQFLADIAGQGLPGPVA